MGNYPHYKYTKISSIYWIYRETCADNKEIVKKALYDNKDMYISLLEYRNTPIGRNLPTPAKLLFGRRLNTFIPSKEQFVKAKGSSKKTFDICKNVKLKQKKYYDKTAKNLPPLVVGDNVMVQLKEKDVWEPAKVIRIDVNRPRAYLAQLKRDGKVFVRNRRFLKKVGVDRFENKTGLDEELEKMIYVQLRVNERNNSHCSEEKTVDLSRQSELVDQKYESVTNKIDNKDNGKEEQITDFKTVKTRYGRTVSRPKYLQQYVQ
ncbi:hypothetical protein DMN91_007665 [Ooceraea biroi]|uniref:Uncharacterized protein n=1 Tax=Ooceraea biroi TaxID=2015173 RepID=A0A3L8DMB0_OOCBI|nr:hypothetical protein DMN91_007665 [Ooceraea biroi]